MPNLMSDRLRAILDYKADEIVTLKRERSIGDFENAAHVASPVRGFAQRMQSIAQDDRNALICEVKRRSPSAGLINSARAPLEAARSYEAGGAACVSVLTDGPSFGGSMDDLQATRSGTTIPVLRKDFMLDPIQIVESRAAGADAILIIMAAVDDVLARELHSVADEWSLAVLLEVHNENELDRALELPSPLVGVNNRNLRTFTTDLGATEALATRVPADKLLISESGVRSAEDIQRLRRCGARGFLIGESLMRTEDPEALVRSFVAVD